MAVFELEKDDRKALIFETLEEMSEFFLEKWRKTARRAVRNSGRFTVALSGGKTPLPFYNDLAVYGKGLVWDKTHIFLVDERLVPHNNPESNFGMIKKALFGKIDIPGINIHRIYIDETARGAAEEYETDLRDFFKLEAGHRPRFDLIMLGIGKDGHTASLFANHRALSENRRLVCGVSCPGAKNERISLALPTINNAKTIIFLVTGRDKAHIINEIIEKKNSNLPALLVKPDDGELYYLMDKDAASRINYRQGKRIDV